MSKSRKILTGGPLKYFNKKKVSIASWGKTKQSYVSISATWYKAMIDEIKKGRRKLGYTQHSLAALLGTTQSEVSRFENGKSNPTVEFLDRLISALELELKVSAKKPKK
jgi:ribosome-binding protein aMBF1 (putative translation factor)